MDTPCGNLIFSNESQRLKAEDPISRKELSREILTLHKL